jgi:putative transposase
VRQGWRGLGSPRRRYDAQPHPGDAAALKAAIERLAGEWPPSGAGRIAARLRREDFPVPPPPVRRLRRAMGRQGQGPARPPRTTCRPHGSPRSRPLGPGVPLVRPDQVGGAESTYGRLPEAFVSLAVLIAGDARRRRGWQLSRPWDQRLTLTALQRALVPHRPELHHADQGGQSAAPLSTQPRHALGGRSRMARVGEATEHGSAERLLRTRKAEAVRLPDAADFHAACQHRGRFLDDVDQRHRLHSALGYLPPVEVETQGLQQEAMALSAP